MTRKGPVEQHECQSFQRKNNSGSELRITTQKSS
jgi:hypothetical protein